MILSACFNPDFGTYSHCGSIPPRRETTVSTLREARAECIAYRDEYQLGSGHWSGGQVFDATGSMIAQISYNGRVWEPGEWSPETREITTDIDETTLVCD